YPERTIVLEHLYQLAKLRPDLPAYRDLSRELMADAMARRQPEQMISVWQEYLSKGEAHHPLAVEDHNRVMFASLKHHDLKSAEKAFERMRSTANVEMVNEACRLLLAEFEKHQMEPKARHYRQLLQNTL
ncbi:MAG: rhomboid family intramembrane serine protease, partial [Marinobacter sp.]|nr:rhomboid family intramembrane serine protease [Marinobacter sp.]